MVGRLVAGFFARNHRALDGVLKTAPLAVAEHGLNLSGIPIFCAMLLKCFKASNDFSPKTGRLFLLITNRCLN